jgi:hypothetical protein
MKGYKLAAACCCSRQVERKGTNWQQTASCGSLLERHDAVFILFKRSSYCQLWDVIKMK